MLTMGTFDGIHQGHRVILDNVINASQKEGKSNAVLTYDPPPPAFFVPNQFPGVLTTTDEKIRILENLGVDTLIILPFDEHLAGMDAEDFVDEILVHGIGVSQLIVGYDHRFGKGGAGNTALLENARKHYGFNVCAVPPVTYKGVVIKSTLIRKLISQGAMQDAAILLDRYYHFTGKVIEGKKRGKILGFPTANLTVEGKMKLLPANGVYAVKAHYNGREIMGTFFIGVAETFGEKEVSVEVNFMDFDENLYGKKITFSIVECLRSIISFGTEKELIEQMKKDVEKSRNILENICVNCF